MVAALAQETSYDTRRVIVVDGKSVRPLGARVDVLLCKTTQEAAAFLFVEQSRVFLDGQSILLEFESFGRGIGFDLHTRNAVGRTSTCRVGTLVELVYRLHSVALLAALVSVDANLAEPRILSVVAHATPGQVSVLTMVASPDGDTSSFSSVAVLASVLQSSSMNREVGSDFGTETAVAPAMPLTTVRADLLHLNVVPGPQTSSVASAADLTDVRGGRHALTIAPESLRSLGVDA